MKATLALLVLLATSSVSFATDMSCGIEGDDKYFEKIGNAVHLGKLTLVCLEGADLDKKFRKTLAREGAGGAGLESACIATNSNGELVLVSIVHPTKGDMSTNITAFIFVGTEQRGSEKCEAFPGQDVPKTGDFE